MLSVFISGGKILGDLLISVSRLLTTNILAVSAMIFIAYAVAIFTYRRGWNPDNFVIPVESSLADTVTTAAILVALALIA
jgi:cation transporter-like permease